MTDVIKTHNASASAVKIECTYAICKQVKYYIIMTPQGADLHSHNNLMQTLHKAE